jgi:hypothetical protein
MVPGMSVIFNQLTRLRVREDFINFHRCKSIRSYNSLQVNNYYQHV